MLLAVADTPAVIWYLYDDRRLSAPARAVFDQAEGSGDTIGLSALTIIEII